VFVPGNPFQRSLVFADKARTYLSEPRFRYSTNIVGFWPYPQTLDLAGKACQKQTLQLITKIRKLRTKKFHNIGLRWLFLKKKIDLVAAQIFMLTLFY
jgi:hypothetical protein